MADATKLPPVPYLVQMADGNGLPSAAWSAWFRQIFNRVGGSDALTNTELALQTAGTTNIFNGSGSPSGALGSIGDYYFETAGAGLGNVYQKTGPSTWTLEMNIAGPAGPAGAAGANGSNGTDGVDGRTIFSGTGSPSSGLGADGDLYLDTAATTLYGPKISGAWGTGVSLLGPPGPAGAPGDQGPEGPPGGAINTSFAVSSLDGYIYTSSLDGQTYLLELA